MSLSSAHSTALQIPVAFVAVETVDTQPGVGPQYATYSEMSDSSLALVTTTCEQYSSGTWMKLDEHGIVCCGICYCTDSWHWHGRLCSLPMSLLSSSLPRQWSHCFHQYRQSSPPVVDSPGLKHPEAIRKWAAKKKKRLAKNPPRKSPAVRFLLLQPGDS